MIISQNRIIIPYLNIVCIWNYLPYSHTVSMFSLYNAILENLFWNDVLSSRISIPKIKKNRVEPGPVSTVAGRKLASLQSRVSRRIVMTNEPWALVSFCKFFHVIARLIVWVRSKNFMYTTPLNSEQLNITLTLYQDFLLGWTFVSMP